MNDMTNDVTNDLAMADPYGALVEPATLKIERILPGPASRVWDWLTKSELRRKWLAAGDMELAIDAPFELIWRNDELNDPPSQQRPQGFSEENRMQSRITALEPGRSLSFTWAQGEVTFLLQETGSNVLLTVIHRRISDRANRIMVASGWHMHLDILAARLAGREPEDFWNGWQRLHSEYDTRIPV